MFKHITWVLIILVLGSAELYADGIQLVVDSNGYLTGARNVTVGGALYDVEFKDGSCVEQFDGCDDASDFLFPTTEEATPALQALLDDVFVDSAAGLFDS